MKQIMARKRSKIKVDDKFLNDGLLQIQASLEDMKNGRVHKFNPKPRMKDDDVLVQLEKSLEDIKKGRIVRFDP